MNINLTVNFNKDNTAEVIVSSDAFAKICYGKNVNYFDIGNCINDYLDQYKSSLEESEVTHNGK